MRIHTRLRLYAIGTRGGATRTDARAVRMPGWRASEPVYYPHRHACTRVVVIATDEVAPTHVIDEVVGDAVRGRHLDHVELPVDAIFLDRFGAAPLNRNLGLERGVELEPGRRWRRFRKGLQLRRAGRRRLTLSGLIGRQSSVARCLGRRNECCT